MLLAALAVTVAIVVQDQTPLRAAAHENATRQTMLTAGDWLEVRGEQLGFLQVYDHRRERPGYVRSATVRSYGLDETVAPKLGALVEYLRDAHGQESLGIGYVALYLRAAPAQAVGAELFDALGTMAERLGERASLRVARAGDGSLAAELEVAESYGVHFVSTERSGVTQVCYDGEAFRRVLALGGTGPARVRAALGLTDRRCTDPGLGTTAALELTRWRSEVLDGVDLATLGPEVPAYERARLRLRRSIVQSDLAVLAARAGDLPAAQKASETARQELALADRSVLADEDRLTYEEAALRSASVRWAAEPLPAPSASATVDVEIGPGAPGQTCVRIRTRASPEAAPFQHCTYGLVWPSSVRVAPHDAAVVMAVELLPGWSELLVLHATPSGWTADTITPAALDPDIGYVELAGFSPDGSHLLVAREARASGPLGAPHTLAPWIRHVYDVVGTADLHVEKEVSSLREVPASRRWETAEWRKRTLALR